MAYLPTSDVAMIRKALKKAYGKAVKFSVTKKDNWNGINVYIMESPFFEDGERGNYTYNHHRDDMNPNTEEFIDAVVEIIKTASNTKYYNNTDAMTDYFDTAFYYTVEVGKWNKPHVHKPTK